jgi:cobalt/nickel transport system permease protein
MEGFLPPKWAIFWWVVALPFFVLGLRSLTRITQTNPELKLLLALSGAFTFVLSALKCLQSRVAVLIPQEQD